MDNYAGLLKAMSDAFLTAVRVLETEIAQLKGEIELLELELREVRERGWDEFMEDEQAREEAAGL